MNKNSVWEFFCRFSIMNNEYVQFCPTKFCPILQKQGNLGQNWIPPTNGIHKHE